ncbi:MAG TPA: PLP-dependent aminotransferase family protein [Xanthobacteraceae bacterium]|nr:PLP-dependent aminotransferase family protein [Xanthobacteraceae bacterium]
MTDWVPSLVPDGSPRYVAFVKALEDDIASGRVKPGMRLLPQREMAARLELSVGTISKAYSEAELRGLISGEVGRGTFVQRRAPDQRNGGNSGVVNLALNVPPYTGEDEVISAALANIAAEGEMANLLSYLPHQGLRQHREAVAGWLSGLGAKSDPDHLFITHGGQHGLSIALGMVASPGDTVLTEMFTYSGMIALSAQNGYRLRGVEGDAHGLVPEALDRAFRETGARALFCMPTLQTPTGTVMPEERRDAIAEIVRRHDAYLVEDDAYAFLFAEPPHTLSERIPERSFYVVSFAKCLAPGLRIAAMKAPDSFRDRCNNGIRATGWMATPLMAEVLTRLIHNGDLKEQVRRKRAKAELRNEIATRALGEWLPELVTPPGFHRWLPLPPGRMLNGLITQAAQAGITIAPPGFIHQVDRINLGVRLCLGHPSEASLERALVELRRILEMAEMISFV